MQNNFFLVFMMLHDTHEHTKVGGTTFQLGKWGCECDSSLKGGRRKNLSGQGIDTYQKHPVSIFPRDGSPARIRVVVLDASSAAGVIPAEQNKTQTNKASCLTQTNPLLFM